MSDNLTLKLVLKATDGMSGVVRQAVRASDADFEKLQRSLKDTAAGFDDFGRKAGMAGGALTAVSGLNAKLAGDFEEGMNNVSTLIDTNVESLGDMSREVLNIGKNSPKAISDLTEGLYSIRSAGISASEQFNVLRGSEKLAVAGLSTTAEAVDIATSAINAFQLKGQDSAKMYDMFFKVVKYGKTNISEFAQGFGSVAGVVSAADIKIDEYSAAVAAMTTTGVKANIAHTQMKAVIAGLSRATDDQTEIFNKLGAKSFKDLIQKSGGMVNALDKIKTAVGGDEAKIISLVGSVEAYNAVMSLTGATNKVYLQTLDDMRNGSDSLSEAYAKQTAGFNMQLKIIGNQFQALGIKLGNGLLPVLKGAGNILRGIIGFLDRMPDGFTNFIAIATAGTGAVLLGLSGMSFAVSGAIKGFNNLLPVIRQADILMWGFSGRIKAIPPVGFNLRASLVAMKNSLFAIPDACRASIKSLGTFFVTCKDGAIIGFKTMLTGIKSGFLNFIPSVKAAAGAIKSFNIVCAANPIGLIVTGIAVAAFLVIKYWKPITAFFRGFFAGLKEGLAPLAPAFKQIGGAVKPIVDWLKRLISPINTAGAASENFGQKIGKAIGDAIVWCAKLIGKMKDIVTLGGRIKFGGKKDAAAPVNGSHAQGLARVPFDGYIAETHKDESILSAPEAKEWRDYKSGGYNSQPIVLNYNPTIEGGAGLDETKILAILKSHSQELMQMLEGVMRRREARSYG